MQKQKKNNTFENTLKTLDKTQSEYLKGIAILLVLTGHGFRWLTPCPWQLLNWAGAIGVSIFLFLSGYGLMESYNENGISTLNWWKNRLQKVMIPFWIMMLFQTILLWKLNIEIGKKDWLLNFLGYVDYDSMGTIDSTMWYITFLMLQYMVFFVTFVMPVPDYIKITAISLLYVLGWINHVSLVSDWDFNYFTFLLGILYSCFRKKLNLNFKVTSLVAVVVLLAISTGYWNSLLPTITVWQIYTYSGLFTFVSLIMLLKDNYNIFNSFFLCIGKYSYEIYLVEGVIIIRLPFIYQNGSSYFNLFYYFTFSIAIGILYKYFLNFIFRKTKNTWIDNR